MNLTAVKDKSSGRDRFENGVVMGRNQYGGSLIVDIAQEAEKFRSEVRIEISGRFVGQDQPRLVCQCAGDGNPLLFPTGERVRQCTLAVLQPETFENLVRATTRFPGRDPVDAKNKCDVLENRLAFEKFKILKNDADFPSEEWQAGPGQLVDPPPGDPNLTVGRAFRRVEESQKGSFSGTRRPGEKNELARFNLQIEILQDGPPLVFLGHIAQTNHGLIVSRTCSGFSTARRVFSRHPRGVNCIIGSVQ